MTPPRSGQSAAIVLLMGLAFACGKGPEVPSEGPASGGDPQSVPFNYQSPSSTPGSVSATRSISGLPGGTPITIRLLRDVSSATAHAGDNFQGIVDDPVLIQGQNVVPRGAAVTGRVLAAKASGRLHDPGYLRIALVSVTVDGEAVAIDTSSLFVKGGHERRDATGIGNAFVTERKEVSFEAERRLTFRLAQAAEFH